MKPILWVRHVKVSASTEPTGSSPLGAPRLSLADKAAFVVLAAGLLALGGVLFAAGLALLLALAAGGLVLGGAAVARRRLFGSRPPAPLGSGEIPVAAVVLPRAVSAPALPSEAPPDPPVRVQRAD